MRLARSLRRSLMLAGLPLAAATVIACPVASAAPGASPACGPTGPPGGKVKAIRPGALEVLVPPGPDALLVCRYRGLSATVKAGGGGVIDSGLMRSAVKISEITAGLDGLKADRHIACPMYEMLGNETATFYYDSGPSVTLTIELGGCSDLSNGHVIRQGLDTPALEQIQSLLRPAAA